VQWKLNSSRLSARFGFDIEDAEQWCMLAGGTPYRFWWNYSGGSYEAPAICKAKRFDNRPTLGREGFFFCFFFC